MLVDTLPELKVIATGSSSFSLSQELGEPLTGRKSTSRLYPISIRELTAEWGGMQLEQRMDDLLELDKVRNARKVKELLILIAYQIGKEVSLNELGQQLGMNRKTVERYLDLLEKAFVIIKVGGFSRNLRKEVTKSHHYYFYDNGIRNALIQDFKPLNLRNDTGMLWENLVVIERIKRHHYENRFVNGYFWRTYDQQEIDWVEEGIGHELHGCECKFSKKYAPVPSSWKSTYPKAHFDVVHRGNYLEFL